MLAGIVWIGYRLQITEAEQNEGKVARELAGVNGKKDKDSRSGK